VQLGGVRQITEKLYELGEFAIKVFEKISFENPHSILTSETLMTLLNMIDFFEISV
jgi:hypothetical protein